MLIFFFSCYFSLFLSYEINIDINGESTHTIIQQTTNKTENSLVVQNKSENKEIFNYLTRLTHLNYDEIIKTKPFSFLLLSDELNHHNNLLQLFFDTAKEFHNNPDFNNIQFLHLDANSLSCQYLVGNGNNNGVWHVRESIFKEEMIFPQCINSNGLIDNYVDRIWLFHWRDFNLISPLRLGNSIDPYIGLTQSSLTSASIPPNTLTTTETDLVDKEITPNPSNHIDTITSQSIASTIINLLAIDTGHTS